ncbi:MAG: hypothetical protein ABI183_11530 [Polyangiaceae bacterium]
MARPVRCRDKWRIRWVDEKGVRQSDVLDTHREAEFELRRHQTEVEERKRGLRPEVIEKTFGDLAAALDIGTDVFVLYAAAIFTGMRADELAALA